MLQTAMRCNNFKTACHLLTTSKAVPRLRATGTLERTSTRGIYRDTRARAPRTRLRLDTASTRMKEITKNTPPHLPQVPRDEQPPETAFGHGVDVFPKNHA